MKGVSAAVIFTILAVIIVAAFLVIFYSKGGIPISLTYDENACRNKFLDLCDKIDKGVAGATSEADDWWNNRKCKQWFREFTDYLSFCSYLLGHPVS